MDTRVKQLREAKGWSAKELARRSGISIDTIKRLEDGNRDTIYWNTLRKLAAALECKVSAIIKWGVHHA